MITVWQGASNPITHPRQQAVMAWLRDNSIDPGDVVSACPIHVDGQLIRYTTFVESGKGRPQMEKHAAIKEPRTAPLIVPWSAP